MGKEVGYAIRFDDKTGEKTRLRYVTDGVLLREAMSDPLLKKYDVVILDEAHERSLDTDILFGLLKQCHAKRTSSSSSSSSLGFRLIVMSATLHVEKFSAYFNDCLFFNIVGKTFPVDILYEKNIKSMDSAKASYVSRAIDTVMHIHKNLDPGDILVFLTGHLEIEQACSRLEELCHEWRNDDDSRMDMVVLPLYAALDLNSQRRVFLPAPEGKRKVVIATNIAVCFLEKES